MAVRTLMYYADWVHLFKSFFWHEMPTYFVITFAVCFDYEACVKLSLFVFKIFCCVDSAYVPYVLFHHPFFKEDFYTLRWFTF